MLAVTAGIALLASGCGGSTSSGPSGSSSTGGSSKYQKELAFSECMRSHGVPNFPDPSSNGALTVTNSGAATGSAGGSHSAMLAAEQTCRHLLPNGGQPSQAQQQRNVKQELKFVQCMRSHGEPNMPDPGSNGALPAGSGVNPQSPQFQKAQQACQSLLPARPGSAP
jgi:hypothetical protein